MPDPTPRDDLSDAMAACRASIMDPSNGHGIGRDLRHALAARMARDLGMDDMARDHMDRMTALSQTHLGVATGGDATDPQIAAMVRHADLVTRTPAHAAAADIAALVAAGLTNPQIVALSELVAFVNYDARVSAGMALLEHAG